jgi:hypothetical protein
MGYLDIMWKRASEDAEVGAHLTYSENKVWQAVLKYDPIIHNTLESTVSAAIALAKERFEKNNF